MHWLVCPGMSILTYLRKYNPRRKIKKKMSKTRAACQVGVRVGSVAVGGGWHALGTRDAATQRNGTSVGVGCK